MDSVAPSTCKMKLFIAEFMFLDSSIIEKLMLSGSGLLPPAEMRTYWRISFLFKLRHTEPMDVTFQIMA